MKLYLKNGESFGVCTNADFQSTQQATIKINSEKDVLLVDGLVKNGWSIFTIEQPLYSKTIIVLFKGKI